MLGVREGVIALISLVAIYMAFVLLRMRRLRQPERVNTPPVAPAIETPPVLEPNLEAVVEDDIPEENLWEKAGANLLDEVPSPAGLVQEVAQLREELDAVRGELAALREDMLQELAHMRATQTVSPIYGDAMQMAAAGYEPAVIAERCGIARAEAELVAALAKSQEHRGE